MFNGGDALNGFTPTQTGLEFIGVGAIVSGGPTLNPAVPSGIRAGDLLVLVGTGAGDFSALPGGWTTRANTVGANPGLIVGTKISDGTETTVAVTKTSTGWCFIAAWRAPACGITSYSVTGTLNTAGPASTQATTTLTTLNALDTVISVYSNNSNAFSAAPSGTVLRGNLTGAGNGLMVVDELQVAKGASTARTATNPASTTFSNFAFSAQVR